MRELDQAIDPMSSDSYPMFAGYHPLARAAAIVAREKALLLREQLRRDETGMRRPLFLPREAVEALSAAGVPLTTWRRMGFTIEGAET